MHTRVSIQKTANYEEETVYHAVCSHFAALELAEDIRPDSRVLIKPNLLMKRNPAQGTTTHPALVKAVVRWLEEQNVSDILIADSPGGPYTKGALTGIYKSCGMEQVAEETSATLNWDFGWETVEHPEGVLCKEFQVIHPIQQADIIINLPKLKTHGMMQLSGAVKNLFGAVPGLQKPELHFRFPEPSDFAQMLVDLSTLVCPTVTLVDAVVSMEGDGPSSGSLVETGMTFGSRNPYVLDLFLCQYIGMPAKQAFTVERSILQGLCPAGLEGTEIVGYTDWKPYATFAHPTSRSVDFMARAPGLIRRPAQFLGDKLLSPKPVVHRIDCIGCGKCEESCAPKAVQVHGGKAKIRYSACIKCYCCHEMCPVKAISIRRAFFWSWF